MKHLLFILFIVCSLISCNKEAGKPAPIKPAPKPVSTIKDFFAGIENVDYAENAKVTVSLRIFVYESVTNVDIDWGDGIIEKYTLISKEDAMLSPLIYFPHKYTKNGDYKINFKSTNAVLTDSVSTEVSVVNKIPKLVTNFSYEILAGGKVKFKNLSSDSYIDDYYWSDEKTINKSHLRDPEFIYEWNDTYTVSLHVVDKAAQSETISKNITITNAIPREMATFKGTLFNENYEFIENNIDCKATLRELDPGNTTMINTFRKNTSEKNIEINMFGISRVLYSGAPNFNLAERYEKFKQQLTIGEKRVGVQLPEQWNASILLRTANGTISKLFNDDPDSSIEITEVREIDQPILFNEVYPKAFWVTFRLKADFKELGKVDGMLTMRYLVYRVL